MTCRGWRLLLLAGCVVFLGTFQRGLAQSAVTNAPATNAVATAESAAAVQSAGQEIWIIKHLKAGGTTTLVQLVLSVFGLGVVLERLAHLRRRTIVMPGFSEQADALWKRGDWAGLEALCGGDQSVLARVVQAVVKHRHNDFAQVSTIAGDEASRAMRKHMQKCYPVAIVATLEPLLGLFGTVVGMIEAFDIVALAGSMGNPAILADSISKALITTEVGLAIAMPALFIYHQFKTRVGSLSIELEEEVSELLSDWFLSAKEEQGHAR